MIETVHDENLWEYEQFIEDHDRGSYLQSSRWAKQNPAWNWHGLICRDDRGNVVGSLSYLVRELPVLPYQVIYVCRGPVCEAEDTAVLEELMEALKQEARDQAACLVRMDMPFADSSPAVDALSRFRFRIRRHKNSAPMYPKRSWIVPILGRSFEAVQRSFTPQTIQSVQIAQRHGLEVRRGGRALVNIFADLMERLSLRDDRVGHPAEYYAGLMENYGDDARIFLAYQDANPVAGCLMIRCGRSYTCAAQAELSAPTLHAMHLLRTAVLQTAADLGLSHCEFPGLPGSRDSNEFRFEAGFGGGPFVYIGEADWLRRPIGGLLSRLIDRIQNYISHKKYFIKIR